VLVALRRLDVSTLGAQLAGARPGWLALAVLANAAVLPLLAAQWRRLLPAGRTVRRGVLGECVALAFAGMNTLPFGGGHALAVGLLATRAGLGLDGALSLLALEQLCEGAAKLALLGLVFAVGPCPAELRPVGWILGATLPIGFGGLYWLARRPAPGGASGGWRGRWGRHLEVVARPRAWLGALALGGAAKLAQLAALYAVQRSLGLDLPLATLPVVLATVSFATMVSVAPGNLVVFEAAAFAAYRWLGVAPASALALALVQHACFLAAMIVPGYALTVWRLIAARRA
jgi:uncharacterized membrane protein YbhN (UPF0104 family)